MNRDFDQNPYSPDERRAAQWIFEKVGIGGGDDPIGFLIACMERFRASRLRRTARRVAGTKQGQHVHHMDGDITNNDPNNLVIVEDGEFRVIEMEGEAK